MGLASGAAAPLRLPGPHTAEARRPPLGNCDSLSRAAPGIWAEVSLTVCLLNKATVCSKYLHSQKSSTLSS